MNFHQRKRTKGMRNLGKQHHKPITSASICLPCYLFTTHNCSWTETQLPLQLQTSKIVTNHFKTFSVVFWCFFWRQQCPDCAQVRWRSDIGGCQTAWSALLCVYSRQSEVISCVSWVSAADWEYKHHAAVVVSVEWSTVNRSCSVLSVTNCDLHNWTATMCA